MAPPFVPTSPIGNAQKSLLQERDRRFESISLQRRVCCELKLTGHVRRARRRGHDWLYYAYFPEARIRDFADFWPPDVIVSEMSATGFAGVDVHRRHVHRERDLAELLSAVRFRERNSQLLSLPDAAYEAGLRCIEHDLYSPQRHKVRSDHLCFVTVRGDRR